MENYQESLTLTNIKLASKYFAIKTRTKLNKITETFRRNGINVMLKLPTPLNYESGLIRVFTNSTEELNNMCDNYKNKYNYASTEEINDYREYSVKASRDYMYLTLFLYTIGEKFYKTHKDVLINQILDSPYLIKNLPLFFKFGGKFIDNNCAEHGKNPEEKKQLLTPFVFESMKGESADPNKFFETKIGSIIVKAAKIGECAKKYNILLTEASKNKGYNPDKILKNYLAEVDEILNTKAKNNDKNNPKKDSNNSKKKLKNKGKIVLNKNSVSFMTPGKKSCCYWSHKPDNNTSTTNILLKTFDENFMR